MTDQQRSDRKYSPLGHPMGRTDANGNWVRNDHVDSSDGLQKNANSFALKFPISFQTADAAVLWKTPKGQRIALEVLFWEVTTPFTGGTSSAIGLSANTAPHETKGDLLGGASGDVLATLTAGIKRGTQGASFTAAPNLVVLEPETEIRFDRITSAFTAGAGFVHLLGRVIE